jgi:hypothetical protein
VSGSFSFRFSRSKHEAGLPAKSAQTHAFWPLTKNWTNAQTGGSMAGKKGCRGLQRLVEKFRNEFNRPENTNFYSETDYKEAERKYVKLCLEGKFEFYDAKGSKL